jgi:type IV pilus assembly protein PilW
MTRLPRRLAQAGFTLIELMVSLVIGFAVVGALLAAYMAAVRSGAHTDAMVQITEDATQALSIIRTQTAMAGYSPVNPGLFAPGSPLVPYRKVAPVFGCAGANFGGDLALGTDASVPCTPAGTSPSDTLEVAYVATTDNSISAAGVPLNCLGNTITADPGAPPQALYINDSKFYVDAATSSLYCHPRGGTAGAPLVDHVEAMKVTYGLADTSPPDPSSTQITHYAAAPPLSDKAWEKVVSVTICVQVRSANKVQDTLAGNSLATYIACDNTPVTNNDGYLRRTFATTVVLQNKLL